MKLIPGGRYRMGTDTGFEYEGPAHDVEVASFWIDEREVTNAEFAAFVASSGYVTDAERFGWSAVFDTKSGEWTRVDGANWRDPTGPESSIVGRDSYPVVQVSWNDAGAYANWAGKRLPTEAEWERAARGGLDGAEYSWGNEFSPGGRSMANTWQGTWPVADSGADGFAGLAPTGSFPANGYGLYDMTGNTWEWVADWFSEDAYRTSPSREPVGPADGTERVIRGGSFLCSEQSCMGFRVAARNKNTPDSASDNLGFRCVRDASQDGAIRSVGDARSTTRATERTSSAGDACLASSRTPAAPGIRGSDVSYSSYCDRRAADPAHEEVFACMSG
jgi:formylglycine-generating enzyme required for sulfatase activity